LEPRIKNKIEKISNQLYKSKIKAKGGAKKAAIFLNKNHEEISDHSDSVAKATKVVAGVAVVGAEFTVSAGAYLYSKMRKKKEKGNDLE